MAKLSTEKRVEFCLAVALVANIFLWFHLRAEQSVWANVPPAPDENVAAAYGLGDSSFAYRINGLQLQNLGDTGGRVTALEDYNYEELGRWFFLQDTLDEQSDYIPYLAAYYFSNAQDVQLIEPVIDYLHHVGVKPEPHKWRWLAQAIYLARFRMKNYDKAFSLAQVLAKLDIDNAPTWVKQMPAFIKGQSGEKEAAYALMLQILKTNGEGMHPTEMYSMRVYMCTRLLSEEQAVKNPLCDGL